jgi:hypothetical protein
VGASREEAGELSKDITSVLAGWEHEPDDLQVRIVPGDDGREKLQMRIELGLLQMELEGRPDGLRPHGFESLLDYHEAEVSRLGPGKEAEYRLGAPECEALMREGAQYYHRYLALFHLDRYDLVARDTSRNLRLFAFAGRHAERARDKMLFDQYRPYVIMMNVRARGMAAMERGDHVTALARIDEGIKKIRAFLREYDQMEDEAKCRELTFLRRWRREVRRERTVGPVERLEEQLGLAVSREQYEEAARLRDQITRLRAGLAAQAQAPQDRANSSAISGDAP